MLPLTKESSEQAELGLVAQGVQGGQSVDHLLQYLQAEPEVHHSLALQLLQTRGGRDAVLGHAELQVTADSVKRVSWKGSTLVVGNLQVTLSHPVEAGLRITTQGLCLVQQVQSGHLVLHVCRNKELKYTIFAVLVHTGVQALLSS